MKFFMRLSMLLLFCLYFSCQSDDEAMPICDPGPISHCEPIINFIPFVDTCYNLPPEPLQGWSYHINSIPRYSKPSFNPELSDELLYKAGVDQTNLWYTLNICTGEKDLVMENPSLGLVNPTWGHDDWIVFTDQMENVWKIKRNGDSLSQITFEHQFKYPTLLPNKRLLFLERDYPEMPNVYRSVIMNMDGEVLDTLEETISISDYYDNKIATAKGFNGEKRIVYFDLGINEFITVINLEGTDHVSIFDIYWLDELHLVWKDNIGLHKVHIESGELTTLISHCDNRFIEEITVSPDLDGIIIFKENHDTLWDSVTLERMQKVYKLDTNTGEQWEIDLSP